MTYPATSDLKAELGITVSTDDTKLGLYVAEAIAFCEEYTGRVFVAVTDTKSFPVNNHLTDASKRNIWTYQEMVSVSALTIDGVTIPSTEYYLSSYDGEAPYLAVKIYPGSAYRIVDSDGKTPVTIAGDWGYSASCPSDLFMGIIAYAVWRYRAMTSGTAGAIGAQSRKGGQTIEARVIPDDIKSIFNNYIKV